MRAWTSPVTELPLEPALPILDSHHHLWEDDRGRYLVGEFLEDAGSGHNIVATVFIECGTNYLRQGPPEMRPVGEVAFVAGATGAAARSDRRIAAAIVGYADMRLGEGVEDVLAAMIAAGGGRFRGIRHPMPWDPGPALRYGRHPNIEGLLRGGEVRAGIACLGRLGLVFDAFMFFHQLADLRDLLLDNERTTVVLNHCGGILGLPPFAAERAAAFPRWRSMMAELALHPNVMVKIGGLGMLYGGWDFHLRPAPPSSTELAEAWAPYVETCIELFGPHRCMFESNFPVDKQTTGYGVLVNAFKRITAALSPSEKDAVYRGTASRIYGIAEVAGPNQSDPAHTDPSVAALRPAGMK